MIIEKDFRKKDSPFSTVCCTSAECPRILEFTMDETNTRTLKLSRDEAMQDTSGNWWCLRCKPCCDLMNWGKAHKWPALETRGLDVTGQPYWYSLAPGYAMWFSTCALGTERRVIALLYAVQIEEASA